MQAILTQLDFEMERFAVAGETIETLFIGGGTPSTVSPEAYAPFFEKVRPFLAEDAEVTTEANPNSATPSWLAGMHALGVNRVSFGVQSFDPQKLQLLGRNHGTQHALEAPWHAKEAGFAHISIDLIYGTRIDTPQLLEEDLSQAFSLPIDHLSAYSLTIEEKTLFYQTPEVSRDDEKLAYRFIDRIRSHFPQYEISNFGNYRSRHNLGYWAYKDYIGIGSGAVGFRKDRRFYPTASVEAYIDNPLQIEEEILDAEAILNEKVLLGLRCEVGVALSLLHAKARQRALDLVEAGKLRLHAQRLYNPNYFLSDEIALWLLE